MYPSPSLTHGLTKIFLKENMDAVDLENSVSTLSQYESKPF